MTAAERQTGPFRGAQRFGKQLNTTRSNQRARPRRNRHRFALRSFAATLSDNSNSFGNDCSRRSSLATRVIVNSGRVGARQLIASCVRVKGKRERGTGSVIPSPALSRRDKVPVRGTPVGIVVSTSESRPSDPRQCNRAFRLCNWGFSARKFDSCRRRSDQSTSDD